MFQPSSCCFQAHNIVSKHCSNKHRYLFRACSKIDRRAIFGHATCGAGGGGLGLSTYLYVRTVQDLIMMENNARRKRKKNKNFEKIRNKLNIAFINKDGTKKNNAPVIKNKNRFNENHSIRKNAVQTKRIIRSSDSNTKYNAMENSFENKDQEIKHSDDIVWNIPYGSGTGDMETFIKFYPQKYSVTERNKELMKIISSYLVDDVDDKISKGNICENQKEIKHTHKVKNYSQRKENEYYNHIPTPNKDMPFSLEDNEISCSEDEVEESPIYTYYPHRLYQ